MSLTQEEFLEIVSEQLNCDYDTVIDLMIEAEISIEEMYSITFIAESLEINLPDLFQFMEDEDISITEMVNLHLASDILEISIYETLELLETQDMEIDDLGIFLEISDEYNIPLNEVTWGDVKKVGGRVKDRTRKAGNIAKQIYGRDSRKGESLSKVQRLKAAAKGAYRTMKGGAYRDKTARKHERRLEGGRTRSAYNKSAREDVPFVDERWKKVVKAQNPPKYPNRENVGAPEKQDRDRTDKMFSKLKLKKHVEGPQPVAGLTPEDKKLSGDERTKHLRKVAGQKGSRIAQFNKAYNKEMNQVNKQAKSEQDAKDRLEDLKLAKWKNRVTREGRGLLAFNLKNKRQQSKKTVASINARRGQDDTPQYNSAIIDALSLGLILHS